MFLEQTGSNYKGNGCIEVICGGMFSGKTEELLRRLRRAEIAGQSCLVFKPKIDTRYAKDEVVSHDASQAKSVLVSKAFEILDLVDHQQVVAIDEAQFLDRGLIDVCNTLAERGKRVIVAGLDMDYNAAPFGPIPTLMAQAEYVTKLHAICIKCGNLAQYSHRTTTSKGLVEIGEKAAYEPLCRPCYQQARTS